MWIEEKNKYGGTERYRLIPTAVGTVKEYEKKIVTTKGVVSESQLQTVNELNAEAQKQYIEQLQQAQKAEEQRKICPYAANNINNKCIDRCAMYDNGCLLSQGTAARDTIGMICPITRNKCIDRCALYNNGCTLNGKAGI